MNWDNYKHLEAHEAIMLRPRFADEIVRLRHTGWFTDDNQDDTTRGVVLRLPHKRGYLIGCSDPWNDGNVIVDKSSFWRYDDEIGAAYAADQTAQWYAEACIESDNEFRAELEESEANELLEAQLEQLP